MQKFKVGDHFVKQINLVTERLNKNGCSYEVHKFDSGAVMIDFWIKSSFHCVQMADDGYGISRIGEEAAFTTIPDSGYVSWSEFLISFDDLMKRHQLFGQ